MSMCVLGMSGDFREFSIAVNALWPRTGINTAAMSMITGEAGIDDITRSVDIMSDAAFFVLRKPTNFTGNFLIDDEVR